MVDSRSKSVRPRRGEKTERHRQKPCEDRCSDRNNMSTSKGNVRSHLKLEEQGRIPLKSLGKECRPVDTLISYFWPPKLEESKFVV